MSSGTIRLTCQFCDNDDYDGITEIPNDWEDVQPVRDDGTASQWWTHIGTCPNCQSIIAARNAMDSACQLIPLSRAEQIKQLKHWQNGGVLTNRERPDIPAVTAEEDAAIRAVWDAIPDGSSSWMTALYEIIRQHTKGA